MIYILQALQHQPVACSTVFQLSHKIIFPGIQQCIPIYALQPSFPVRFFRRLLSSMSLSIRQTFPIFQPFIRECFPYRSRFLPPRFPIVSPFFMPLSCVQRFPFYPSSGFSRYSWQSAVSPTFSVLCSKVSLPLPTLFRRPTSSLGDHTLSPVLQGPELPPHSQGSLLLRVPLHSQGFPSTAQSYLILLSDPHSSLGFPVLHNISQHSPGCFLVIPGVSNIPRVPKNFPGFSNIPCVAQYSSVETSF